MKLNHSSVKSISLKEGRHVFYPSCLSPNFPFQILCVDAASGRDRAFPRLAYISPCRLYLPDLKFRLR